VEVGKVKKKARGGKIFLNTINGKTRLLTALGRGKILELSQGNGKRNATKEDVHVRKLRFRTKEGRKLKRKAAV